MSVDDARIAFCLEAQKRLGDLYRWGGESDAEGGVDCSGLVHACFLSIREDWPKLYDGIRRTAADLRSYFTDRGCVPIESAGALKPGCLVFLARPSQRIHHVRIHLYTSPLDSHRAIEAGGGDSDNTTDKQSLWESACVRYVASHRPSGGWWGAVDPFGVLENA
jgi:hypothetical protein